MATSAHEAMTATGGGRRLHGQGREGGRGDVVAVDDAAREGEHVLLLWTKPWDGRGYCPLRDHGGCRCERGRQANVGDRVEAREPPGACRLVSQYIRQKCFAALVGCLIVPSKFTSSG